MIYNVTAKDVKWNGRRYRCGDQFSVESDREQRLADVLVLIGKAELAPVVEAKPVRHVATVSASKAEPEVKQAEPAPADGETDAVDLTTLTRAKLIALAAERGVAVETDDNRADLIAKLSA